MVVDSDWLPFPSHPSNLYHAVICKSFWPLTLTDSYFNRLPRTCKKLNLDLDHQHSVFTLSCWISLDTCGHACLLLSLCIDISQILPWKHYRKQSFFVYKRRIDFVEKLQIPTTWGMKWVLGLRGISGRWLVCLPVIVISQFDTYLWRCYTNRSILVKNPFKNYLSWSWIWIKSATLKYLYTVLRISNHVFPEI